jgi:hypothetical protein
MSAATAYNALERVHMVDRQQRPGARRTADAAEALLEQDRWDRDPKWRFCLGAFRRLASSTGRER